MEKVNPLERFRQKTPEGWTDEQFKEFNLIRAALYSQLGSLDATMQTPAQVAEEFDNIAALSNSFRETPRQTDTDLIE